MCGRYTNKAKTEEIEKEFEVVISQEKLFTPRYNIAPTQIVPVVLESKGERIINQLRWGLIPSWAKDDSLAAKMINARAETLAEKPSFKNAFKSRRCIIPATGFYEWQQTRGGKQPFYFFLRTKEVFGMAGLYDEWLNRETGESIETFTIITTEANEVLAPVHERMPVILKAEDYHQWLDEKEKNTDQLQNLLIPYPAGEMTSHPVSKAVNVASTDSEDLIKPLNSF